jgi:hypothetical protein
MNKNIEIIDGLPGNTRMFYGHEYAVPNLEFAKFVDYDNIYVDNKL